MRALVVDRTLQSGFGIIDKDEPVAEIGNAIVLVKSVSLNRRDYWCTVGKYPGIKTGVTLGSDACGIVIEAGCNEGKIWKDKEVIINPVVKTLNSPKMPSLNYKLLGMPYDGTFAQYIKVPYDRLVLKPGDMDFNQASALPLAGLTAYRAVVMKAKIQPGDRVLITGIGGGVAQFSAQFSKSIGANVCVTTSSKSKEILAGNLGYQVFNYKDAGFPGNICQSDSDYFDSIIDGAGGDLFFPLLKKLKLNGNMVLYGATSGQTAEINLPALFFGQYNIMGTTAGTDEEFSKMIDFVKKEKILPAISSIFPFSDFRLAFHEMESQEQFGKIVMTMN